MLRRAFLIFLIFMSALVSQSAGQYLMVYMDLEQTDHLKAYGLAYYCLSRDRSVEWLLNYRGGSFLLPDFRAAERTFQLMTQVAGRAGRGLLGGRVIVQTYNPAHFAIQASARHDYSAFAEQELRFRREQGYPPYHRLARLEYRHRSSERARLAAEDLARTLRAALVARGLPPEDLIGPAPAFFAKRRDLFRWHIILRAEDPADLLRQVEISAGWRVDIDPVSVL